MFQEIFKWLCHGFFSEKSLRNFSFRKLLFPVEFSPKLFKDYPTNKLRNFFLSSLSWIASDTAWKAFDIFLLKVFYNIYHGSIQNFLRNFRKMILQKFHWKGFPNNPSIFFFLKKSLQSLSRYSFRGFSEVLPKIPQKALKKSSRNPQMNF